jgi:hypothetical protein
MMFPTFLLSFTDRKSKMASSGAAAIWKNSSEKANFEPIKDQWRKCEFRRELPPPSIMAQDYDALKVWCPQLLPVNCY